MERIASLRGILEIIGLAPISLDAGLSFDENAYYGRYELAADTTAQSVNFGPVTTASLVYIETDGAISVNINALGNLTLNQGKFLLFNCSITSIALTEGASSNRVLKILIAGT